MQEKEGVAVVKGLVAPGTFFLEADLKAVAMGFIFEIQVEADYQDPVKRIFLCRQSHHGQLGSSCAVASGVVTTPGSALSCPIWTHFY